MPSKHNPLKHRKKPMQKKPVFRPTKFSAFSKKQKKRGKNASNQWVHKNPEISNARLLVESEPAIELVEINGKKFVKKTPVKTWKKFDRYNGGEDYSKYVSNPKYAETMVLAESIALRGVWRIYSRLLRKGVFKRTRNYGKKGVIDREYFLRPLRIHRVNTSKKKATDNFLLTEFIKKPGIEDLYLYFLKGDSGQGKTVNKLCKDFIKKNNLGHYMETEKSRKYFGRLLDVIAGELSCDLDWAAEEFKETAIKKHLNLSFGFDFLGSVETGLGKNVIVESVDKNGKFHFVLIDPIKYGQNIHEFPSVTRTKKRNGEAKFLEWDGKRKKEFYSPEGHPKRRKK